MKKRISLLIAVLSAVSDAPNTNDARSRILQWILDEASRTGGNKHLVRRNLIWSNRVRGPSATDKFSDLVWEAAANGQHDALVNTVRATSDEQALRDHLASLGPQTTLSARWIQEQVTQHDLDRRLTSTLIRRAYMDYNELRSLVGVWLGQWGFDGTFDEVLEAEGTVHIRVLVKFLRGKIRSHHFRRGTEPLERMRGARTECEVNHMRMSNDPDYITRGAERSDPNAPDVIGRRKEQDGREEDTVFISDTMNPEAVVACYRDTSSQINTLREMTRLNHGAAGDRFVRFFDHLADGMTFDEMAREEDCSRERAKKIINEIRAGLRSTISRERAVNTILRAIEEEPFSTANEIESNLQIEADVVEECLRMLCHLGTVTEFSGQSYILTRNL